MKLATYIANFIEALGGDYTFGIAGVPNLEIYHALRGKNIHITQNTHEANSIYSCIGAYLYTKKPHFSVVTAGPGVTNCLTALSDAYLNSTPVFLISINSNSEYYGTGEKHDSSSGDNGIDTIHLTKKICCFNALGLSAKNTVFLLERAYKLCYYQKKPVHISLAKDFLNQDIGTPLNIDFILSKLGDISPSLVHQSMKENISKIGKALIIINTEVLNNSLIKHIEEKNIFIADTMKNFGQINHIKTYMGCYEYIQNISLQKTLKIIDTIIVIGGSITKHFFENQNQIQGKNIIHITDSPANTENIQIEKYTCYIGDIHLLTKKLIDKLPVSQYSLQSIQEIQRAGVKYYNEKYKYNLNYHFFQYLNHAIPQNSSIFVGVGGSNNLANVFLRPDKKVFSFLPSSFFNMGHCMKVIGYAHYNKTHPNFVVMGDGNYYMNGNDILTAIEQELNINIIILNNSGYSSLSAWNNKSFERNGTDNFNEYIHGMDFKYIAKSLGCKYICIKDIDKISSHMKNINIYKGVNIIEIKTPFLDKIPL